MKNLLINFGDCGGPVYSGRPKGAALRSTFKLDIVDLEKDKVVDVLVPESTYAITNSFFLGLFGPSVISAGTPEAFFSKFHFNAKPALQDSFNGYVANALQANRLAVGT